MTRRDSRPPELNIFGDNLVRLRKAAGLTQEQLAVKAELSRLSVSNLERGTNQEPKRSTVEALAAALRVDPAEFSRRPHAAAVDAPQLGEEPRISLDEFLTVARGVLEREDIPRGLAKRAWLRTVIDLREEDDGDLGDGGRGTR